MGHDKKTAKGCGHLHESRVKRCDPCRIAMLRAHAAETFVERFLARIDMSGDCWLWTGAIHSTAAKVRRRLTEEKRCANEVTNSLRVMPWGSGNARYAVQRATYGRRRVDEVRTADGRRL